MGPCLFLAEGVAGHPPVTPVLSAPELAFLMLGGFPGTPYRSASVLVFPDSPGPAWPAAGPPQGWPEEFNNPFTQESSLRVSIGVPKARMGMIRAGVTSSFYFDCR